MAESKNSIKKVEKAERRNRVDTQTAVAMVIVALFFDILQALVELGTAALVEIPVIDSLTFLGVIIGFFISIFAWLTFYVWTSIKGWGMSDTAKKFVAGKIKVGGKGFDLKKVLIKFVTPLVEMIPYLNIVPTWTISILVQMSVLKAEDALYNSTHGELDADTLADYFSETGGLPDTKRIINLTKDKYAEKFEKALALKEGLSTRNVLSLKNISTQASSNTSTASRFNLARPEGYGKNKKKRMSLHDQTAEPDANFRDLNRTGEKIVDEEGNERVVAGTTYNISPDTNLHVRGNDYTYRQKGKPENTLSAEYRKNDNELVKMHFNSDNPYFSGKSIIDLTNRIPAGTEILGGETSMSTDSFPLLLNGLNKNLKRDPGRFTATQIGEFPLNDQGRLSNISKAGTLDTKVDMLNQEIGRLNAETGLNLTPARKEIIDGEEQIVVPKVKVTKNF